MEKNRERSGFTLVEIMVVIFVIGILAAVVIPIIRGRNEHAKWSEAAVTAGIIRTAVHIYYAENPIGATAIVGSTVDTAQGTLGFTAGDLTSRYFQASNFTISAVDGNGHATITVAAPASLSGSGQLDKADGWVYTP